MQKTDGRGGLRSGVRYYFCRYVASGMTSEARWKFGANRSSFKGRTDKRTLQLYIIDDQNWSWHSIIWNMKNKIEKPIN